MERNLNLLDTFPHKVIKKRHLGTYYKYLIFMCDMYFVFLFTNDMEVIWECSYLKLKHAIYAYNHIQKKT